MHRRFARCGPLVILAAMLTIAPSPVRAQEVGALPMPTFEISAGYTFLRENIAPDDHNIDFPVGWYASTAFNFNQGFGLVGEATGSYNSDSYVTIADLKFTTDRRLYTFMAGPRFSHKAGRLIPYAQVLAGGAYGRESTVSDTRFAFQPGGGLTMLLTEHLGVRVAGDYRCIIDFVGGEENDYTNQLRFLAGFSLHWGAR